MRRAKCIEDYLEGCWKDSWFLGGGVWVASWGGAEKFLLAERVRFEGGDGDERWCPFEHGKISWEVGELVFPGCLGSSAAGGGWCSGSMVVEGHVGALFGLIRGGHVSVLVVFR